MQQLFTFDVYPLYDWITSNFRLTEEEIKETISGCYRIALWSIHDEHDVAFSIKKGRYSDVVDRLAFKSVPEEVEYSISLELADTIMDISRYNDFVYNHIYIMLEYLDRSYIDFEEIIVNGRCIMIKVGYA